MTSSEPLPGGGGAPDVPLWLRRVGGIAWRLVAVGVAVWLVAELVQKLTVVALPIAIALLLTGVLEPVVDRLRRLPGPDWVAPLVTVLTVLVVVLGTLLGLGVRLADQLPELRSEFSSSVQDLEERYSVELPALPGSTDAGSASGRTASDSLASDATRVIDVGAQILFGFFLSLALTFLFLKDGRMMWRWVLAKLDGPVRDDVDAAGRAAWDTVGSYVRSLTVVALFDAAGVAVGLAVLGVPLVLTLAALQFIGSYVPTIGAFVAGGVAVVVAFGSGGFTTAAITLAIVVVVQQLGNDVIEPWVMGRSVDLHPALVLIAVGTGAVLWGIAGALLFVPLLAALSAAGHVLWERHGPTTTGTA